MIGLKSSSPTPKREDTSIDIPKHKATPTVVKVPKIL